MTDILQYIASEAMSHADNGPWHLLAESVDNVQ